MTDPAHRLAEIAGHLGLAPRVALLAALRHARAPQVAWHVLLDDARRIVDAPAARLFATPVAEFAQGETDRALALLFARAVS